MHDPMTVAHEIKYPWFRHKPWPRRLDRFDAKVAWERMTDQERSVRNRTWRDGYRDRFITIWHVDPEADGSDDSCGYCTLRLTRRQREWLASLACREARNPYFIRCRSETWTGTRGEAECLYRGLVLAVARCIGVRMSFDEAAKRAAEHIHYPDGMDRANSLCFLPGYHTNFTEDRREYREDHVMGVLCGIARWMLRDRRPWYRHPKWHVWHWRLQIHPLQGWWRRTFAKCDVCGCKIGGSARIGTCWDTPHVGWWKRLFSRKPWYVRHEACADPAQVPQGYQHEHR